MLGVYQKTYLKISDSYSLLHPWIVNILIFFSWTVSLQSDHYNETALYMTTELIFLEL